MRVIFCEKIKFNEFHFTNCFVVQKRFLLFFWKTIQVFETYSTTYRCDYVVETNKIKQVKQKAIDYMKSYPEIIRLEKFEKQIAKKEFKKMEQAPDNYFR